MDDRNSDIRPVTASLKGAMRRARIEDAERSDVVAELRGAEQARLEMLAEALEPVFVQLPEDVDMFDAGLVPGEKPRLYIDMIAFVEMAKDQRTYCFVQDTRHGRVIVAESERSERMVAAITDYIARRLLERERALASDRTVEDAARVLIAGNGQELDAPPSAEGEPASLARAKARALAYSGSKKMGLPDAASDEGMGGRWPGATQKSAAEPGAGPVEAPSRRRRLLGKLWNGVEFLALFAGFVVLLIALAGALYFGWTLVEGWWVSYFSKST